MKTGIFIFGVTLYVMQPDFMKVCFALVNCLLIISKRFFPWACLREGGGSQVGEITYGRSPNLTYKCDHIKIRFYGKAGYPTLAGYLTYLGSPTST